VTIFPKNSDTDEKIEELVASGMPRKKLPAAARREFGNVPLTKRTAA